mgnify:CR=1 FL=1
MDNTRRRAYIKEKLEQADHRLRGMDLAKECGVSRQVIVGDMALLRARAGYHLYAAWVLSEKREKSLPSHTRLPSRPGGDRKGAHCHRKSRRHHP